MKMRLFSLLTVALLVASTGRAETTESVHLIGGIGPVIGLNFGNTSLTPSSSTDSRTGLLAGVATDWFLTNYLAFHPEVEYIQEGYSQSLGNLSYTTQYDAIKIPLLFKPSLDVTPDGNFSVYALLGPAFAFRVKSQVVSGNTITENSSQTESMNISLDFGAGAQYWLNPQWTIGASVRYALGLKNLSKVANLEVKSRDLQILASAMYMF